MRRRGLGVLAVVGLTLALPATASATSFSTATVAPIGTGSYLVTVTNTGTKDILGLLINATNMTGIVSDAGCLSPGAGGVACGNTIAAGTSVHVCYTGDAPTLIRPGGFTIAHSDAPATSCPLAGFTPGGPPAPTPTPATPAPTESTPTTTGAPAAPAPVKTTTPKKKPAVKWKRARCVSSYRSWKAAHKRATAKQKKAQKNKLKTKYGCSLAALK